MKSFLSHCFTPIVSVCLLSMFITASLPAATIAHWNFEDGTAGTAFSAMPSGGTVDVVNGYVMRGYNASYGPSFTNETPTGSGLGAYCNGGQDGYTTGAAINAWSPEVWTIEISARLDDISGWETLIGRDGSTNGDSESDFYLQKNAANGAFRINYETVTGQRWILDSDFAVESGQWYHLAVTSDGQTLTMYCDKLDGNGYQVVNTLDISSQTPAENALASSGDNWTFGRGWWNGNFTDHIIGYFDNVRFSDAVLSPTEFLGYNPVMITETDGKTLLFAGDTVYADDYSIVLLHEPLDDVTVTVTPPAGLTVGNGDGQSLDLKFSDLDWNQPRTVTVSIADAGAVLNDIEIIQHTAQSNDSNYNSINISDVQVHIEEDTCGIWGYLEADYNLDCVVDLEDFAILGRVWLATESPLNLQDLAGDWLLHTLEYDEFLYTRSIQESDQPFFVNPSDVQNTIDEKIYGHFLEHIYHSVNGGLWGELVWNRSFELDGSSGGGSWSIEGDDLVQSSLATDVHMEFGDTAWSDYEMTLEAQKDGGNEAFLILFRATDSDNFYWCNIGGWGNTQHAIEKEVNGSRTRVTSYVTGSINTGQWYDIRIRCVGNNFQVWLNENQIFDYTDAGSAHLAGMIGLGTWATQARYRNIQVTKIPDSTVLFTGLPELSGYAFDASFWTVFGTGAASMESDALNDNRSVRIDTTGGGTGLQQDHFKFIPQAYHGSLWMKGALPAGVLVELLDGTTVLGQAVLPGPDSIWTEYPFQITPTAGTDDGSLRITLQGAGTVHIDQVSLMGQDAADTGGFRPDLLGAIEDLHPPIIRWPGGCFASLYLWKDGIGPQHTRHKYPAYMWDDQDTNSYGTDEFLQMCRAIGAEPLIVVNTGLLDSACGAAAQYKLPPGAYLQYALDWIEYCNGPVESYWGSVRAANGHPEPYNVKYWEIDNETWAAGVNNYVDTVNLFAEAMRNADPTIKIIACGSGGFNQSWNRTVIDGSGYWIDYISTHHYESPDSFKWGPRNYEAFIEDLGAYIANSDYPDIKIYMSEWNAQSTDWRTGLYAGGLLNAFERTGSVFEIGGPALFLRHTSATGWDNAFINFDHTGWFPAPNYVVMKLWRDHYAPYRVQTTGADTNLNVVTVKSEDGRTLIIRVVNPDPGGKSVAFEIDGSFVPETAYMRYVAPGSLYARNTLAEPDAVHVQAKIIGIDGQILRFLMPGYSAGVITVETH